MNQSQRAPIMRLPKGHLEKFRRDKDDPSVWIQGVNDYNKIGQYYIGSWLSTLMQYLEDDDVKLALHDAVIIAVDPAHPTYAELLDQWERVCLAFVGFYQRTPFDRDRNQVLLNRIRKQVDEDIHAFIKRYNIAYTRANGVVSAAIIERDRRLFFIAALERDIQYTFNLVTSTFDGMNWISFTQRVATLYNMRNAPDHERIVIEAIIEERHSLNNLPRVTPSTPAGSSDPFETPRITAATHNAFLQRVMQHERNFSHQSRPDRPQHQQQQQKHQSNQSKQQQSTNSPSSSSTAAAAAQTPQKRTRKERSQTRNQQSSSSSNAAPSSDPTTQASDPNYDRQMYGNNNSNNNTGTKTERGQGPCSECQASNHAVTTCPRMPGHAYSSEAAARFRGRGPVPPFNPNKGRGGGSAGSGGSNIRMLRLQNSTSVSAPARSYSLRIKLFGRLTSNNLFDTGSEGSHISTAAYCTLPHPRPPITSSSMRLLSADNTVIANRGTTNVPITFLNSDNTEYTHTVRLNVVDDLAVPLIFGLDLVGRVLKSIRIPSGDLEFYPSSSNPEYDRPRQQALLNAMHANTSFDFSFPMVKPRSTTDSENMSNFEPLPADNVTVAATALLAPRSQTRVAVRYLSAAHSQYSDSTSYAIRPFTDHNNSGSVMQYTFKPFSLVSSSINNPQQQWIDVINNSDRPITLQQDRPIAHIHARLGPPRRPADQLTCETAEAATWYDTARSFIRSLVPQTSSSLRTVASPSSSSAPSSTVESFDINPALTVSERQQLLAVLDRCRDSFTSKGLTGPTLAHDVVHTIRVGQAKPIKQAPYRATPANQLIIKENVQKLLDAGLIVPSNSPWASPVILVTKSDGTFRMCVDYRRLNSCVIKDGFPLPRIEDCINTLSTATHLSIIDLKEAYHHIKLDPESQPLSAFVTQQGLYQWKVMTFGHTNAPGTFQRYITHVLRQYLNKICVAYFDDIVVFTTGTIADHAVAVEKILTQLRIANLTAKMSKCHFGYTELKFLGHIISNGTVRPDPEKVSAVANFPQPVSVPQLRSFLGLANYYRNFIRDFAKIAKPLYRLTRKNVNWEWTPDANQAFVRLKSALLSSECLHSPNYDRPFILQTDASADGFGAVLAQTSPDGSIHPVGFVSTQLTKAEKNYAASDLECAAVVWAIKQFDYMLRDRHFTVQTDHRASEWLPLKNTPNKRLMRAFIYLSEFTFDVVHRPGKSNANADALSRNALPLQSTPSSSSTSSAPPARAEGEKLNKPFTTPIIMQPQSRFNGIFSTSIDIQSRTRAHAAQPNAPAHDRPTTSSRIHTVSSPLLPSTEAYTIEDASEVAALIREQQNDAQLKPIIRYLQLKEVPTNLNAADRRKFERQAEIYVIHPDTKGLYYTGTPSWRAFQGPYANTLRLVVPALYKLPLIDLFHNSPLGGHVGITRTFRRIATLYYWTTLWTDVVNFIQQCVPCQTEKVRRRTPAAHEERFTAPTIPFHTIAMDYIGPLPQSEDFRYALVIIDMFTRYAIAIPVIAADAHTTASVFLTEVYCRFGAPNVILTDQGSHFVSKFLQELWTRLSIDKRQTTAYHPQCNGMVERLNGTLKTSLRILCDLHPSLWAQMLPFAVFAYNNSIHEFTTVSPHFALFLREPRLPYTLSDSLNEEPAGNNPMQTHIADTFAVMKYTHKFMQFNNDAESIRRYSRNITQPRILVYAVGDLVYFARPASIAPAWKPGTNAQLQQTVTGHAIPKNLRHRAWHGPYEVIQRIGTSTYEIRLVSHPKGKSEIVNVSQLKLHRKVADPLDDSSPSTPASTAPLYDSIDAAPTPLTPSSSTASIPDIVDEHKESDAMDVDTDESSSAAPAAPAASSASAPAADLASTPPPAALLNRRQRRRQGAGVGSNHSQAIPTPTPPTRVTPRTTPAIDYSDVRNSQSLVQQHTRRHSLPTRPA